METETIPDPPARIPVYGLLNLRDLDVLNQRAQKQNGVVSYTTYVKMEPEFEVKGHKQLNWLQPADFDYYRNTKLIDLTESEQEDIAAAYEVVEKLRTGGQTKSAATLNKLLILIATYFKP